MVRTSNWNVMKKIYYILTIGLIAGVVSCSDEAKQAAEPEGVKNYTKFYANVEDDLADTRSLLVNDKKTLFVEGDKIQLYVDGGVTAGSYYSLDYQTSSNTFDVGVGYAPITGSKFYAIYPSGATFNLGANKYVVKLEHNFNFRRDMYSATQLMPLWGESSVGNNTLNFSHMAGLIRISLSGSLKVTKITLKGNNGEQIGGAAEVDYTKDKPVLEMSDRYHSDPAAYEQVMTVAEANPYVQLSASPTSFYFVVPPITFSKGITVIVEADGLSHPIVKTTTSPVEVGRAIMKSFTTVDTDAILQAEADTQLDALKALFTSLGGEGWINKWDTTKPLSDAASWPGVTADSKGMVTKINLSNNGLTGSIPAAIGDLIYLEDINLSGNSISGGIPKGVKGLSYLKTFNVSGNQMNDSVPYVVYTSDAWGYADKNLSQQSGYALKTKYASSDYSKDGEAAQILTHSEGPGIPVVITSDAYTDDMYNAFKTDAEKAMDFFFSIAPYKDFKDYFDVYRMMAVSPNNEVDLNLAFSTKYDGDSYSIDTGKVKKKIADVMGLNTNNLLVIVLLNETKAEPNRAKCFYSSDGFATAIAPVDDNLEGVIHHEAGGHGFAFLEDEYSSDGDKSYGAAERAYLDQRHSLGWSLNLSYNNTNTTVPWKDFWTDPAYAPEAVGAYEGGDAAYKYGVYRSTENSTMNNQYAFDKFNPQSRWLIYQEICKRAGLACTLEAFKAYDAANISYMPPSVSVTTRNYVEKKNHKLGAPPVIIFK